MQYNWGELVYKAERVVSGISSAKQHNLAENYIRLVIRSMIRGGAHHDYIKAVEVIAVNNKMISAVIASRIHTKNVNASMLASFGIFGW